MKVTIKFRIDNKELEQTKFQKAVSFLNNFIMFFTSSVFDQSKVPTPQGSFSKQMHNTIQ